MNNQHIEKLKDFYGNKSEWIDHHKIVIDQSRCNKLAICGSFGRYIYKNKTEIPNDLDFVTDNLDDALNYVSFLQKYAMGKKYSYGKILFQNNTKFCLTGVKHHLRFESSFWKPICIFVLEEELKYWFKWGLKLQYMEDNQKYKKKIDEKRNKNSKKEEESSKEINTAKVVSVLSNKDNLDDLLDMEDNTSQFEDEVRGESVLSVRDFFPWGIDKEPDYFRTKNE